MRLPKLLRRIRPSHPTAVENREALERGKKLCEGAWLLNGSTQIQIMQAAWTVRADDVVCATQRGLVARLRGRVVRLRGTGVPIGVALEDGHRGDLVSVAMRGIFLVGPELPK